MKHAAVCRRLRYVMVDEDEAVSGGAHLVDTHPRLLSLYIHYVNVRSHCDYLIERVALLEGQDVVNAVEKCCTRPQATFVVSHALHLKRPVAYRFTLLEPNAVSSHIFVNG